MGYNVFDPNRGWANAYGTALPMLTHGASFASPPLSRWVSAFAEVGDAV